MDRVVSIRPCGAWPKCTVVEIQSHTLKVEFHSGDIENVRPSEISALPSLRNEDARPVAE